MSATIFSNSNTEVKALKSNLSIGDTMKWLSGSADPSSSAVSAPRGSLYTRTGASGGQIYRKKDDGLSTNWEIIGSGAGGTNYITEPGAEASVGTAVAYKDAAGASPVDGTGGSPTVTITRTTSSPLFGNGSYLITKDAANRQGEGVAWPFTIERGDQAKVMAVSFDYEVASGTFQAGDSSDLKVFIYDVTNAALIPVIPNSIQGNPRDTFRGIFQTSATSLSYRLIVHVATTSALAFTFKLDQVSVTPQTIVYGSPVGDWVAYTPTLTEFGTVSNVQFYSRRVGDTLEVKGLFTLGTPLTSQARITLGYGGTNGNVIADTSKVPPGSVIGVGGQDAQSATFFGVYVLAPASDQNYVNISNQTSTQNILQTRNGDDFGGSNFTVAFAVPILGWASNTELSQDAETRIVSAGLTTTAGFSGTTNNPLVWDVVDYDTHAAYDAGTGLYTVPVSGLYQISGGIQQSANNLLISINGVQSKYATQQNVGNTLGFSVTVKVVAGDTIALEPTGNCSIGGGGTSYVQITRVSGPAAIAASETVLAVIGGDVAVPYTGSVPMIYDTPITDTHGAYNETTGEFTVPVSGSYRVNMSYAGDVANNAEAYVFLDGVQYAILSVSQAGGVFPPGMAIVKANAGQVITVQTIATFTLTDDTRNQLSFERIK